MFFCNILLLLSYLRSFLLKFLLKKFWEIQILRGEPYFFWKNKIVRQVVNMLWCYGNMRIIRGILWGITIHHIHKGEVLFSLVCTFRMVFKVFELNVESEKGPQGLEKILTINVLISFNQHFHPLLSYGDSFEWLVCVCLYIYIYTHKSMFITWLIYLCV